MLMDDKQKNFLSALGTGEAVVFTEKLAKPVHIAITPITDTNEAEILDDVVHRKYIDFMERTHQRILLDNEIVNVLYAMYNHSLNQYIATNPPTADSKLADTLHKFCQKYAEELSLIDVLNVLTKEKAKRDMGDDAFVNRLLVFTRHNLLGDSSVPPLLEIPLEVLTGTLKDMAKSY